MGVGVGVANTMLIPTLRVGIQEVMCAKRLQNRGGEINADKGI